MVRGKTELKRIENATSRQVTFTKRRSGLLKKAFELSVLCDAEVSLIIFSQKGKLYEFSSSSTNKTIERYQKTDKNLRHDKILQDTEHLKEEVVSMSRKQELLENSKRRLLGQDLDACSIDELEQVEEQLDRSLKNIRTRKVQPAIQGTDYSAKGRGKSPNGGKCRIAEKGEKLLEFQRS
ncbi:hypothetical protein RND71_005102 [Anisodus tanguticus]|uniref:Uncharacterized protein n=1 Tax=Anisodus tanguticus TaxID=243964 RepID=A0AAE1VV91_9SOLA|nr:hypothetical protein RND71_005102 [Anisodus tanguticus]